MKIARTHFFFFLLHFCCLGTTMLSAQVSINNGDCALGINIPDENCVDVEISVAGAPGNLLGQNVFLEEVRLIINHNWRNDLDLTLIAPDGITTVKLINKRGGSGNHFGMPAGNDCSQPLILTNSTCTTDSIKNASSATEAIGYFRPEEAFSNLYIPANIDPNGNWTLKLCDSKAGDLGVLEYVKLVFVPQGCPAPTNLDAFNITATTIDLDWENNGQCGGNVIVEYGPEGFTPGNGTTAGSANSQVVVLPCFEDFDLLNLTQLTTYDIYVRQTCNTYSYSYNSCKVTVQTDCSLPAATLEERFDTQALCGANGTCIDCPSINGVWSNAITDDIDWIVHKGGTATSQTGPSNDADVNGQYIYIESSGTCRQNKEAILISDCIQVNADAGICHLSFYYHLYGVNINELNLELTTDGTNWTTIWSIAGDQGNQWVKQYIDLSAYHEQVVQFRFRGLSSAVNFRGDMALDQIIFYGSELKPSAVFYKDMDGDGFGNQTDSVAVCFASPPADYVANNLDCDDNNPNIHPNANEITCNGIDENCTGNADDIVLFNPTFSSTIICSGEVASITVTPSNGGQIYWYDAAAALMPIDSGVSFITPNLLTARMYYFKEVQRVSGQICESDVITVPITVHAKPAISNASGNQNICKNTNFDLRTLVIQDANNATDTLLYFSDAAYTSQLANPIVHISSDSTFYIQARSNNGCSDSLAVAFFKQEIPIATINAPDTLKLCFQSAPQLLSAAVGGTGTYEYQWSTGTQGIETIVFSRSKNFIQQLELTVVSQGNACTATDQIIIQTLPSISSIEVLDIQEPGFCQTDGQINVEPKDGQGPYDYAWSGASSGNSLDEMVVPFAISNLDIGAYDITVTDNFGCSKTLPQQFVNGADLGINRVQDVSCFGQNNGAIDLRVGGLINPTYQWSDGTTVFSTNQNVAGLSGGIYSVTIDADNVSPCPIDSIIVKEPTQIEILNENIENPTCAGLTDASIELTVTGGTPTTNGYNYTWNNGLGNTANPQNLAPNTYILNITDSLNCSITDTIIIEATPDIAITLMPSEPSCFGGKDGALEAMIEGGTGPYSYQWDDSLQQTTATAVGLSAGIYEVIVMDANACMKTIKDTLENPAALQASIANIQSPLCNEISNGYIALEITGGTGSYNYLWNTTATTDTLKDIGAGMYAVSISDANNCMFILDSIQVNTPDLMEIQFETIENPVCIGLDNGRIETSVIGGTAPYHFTWNRGDTTANINNLKPADYILQVEDANGCTLKSDTTTLTTSQLLSVDDFITIDPIQCQGTDNAVVFYRVLSGAPNATSFSFQWKDSTLITDNSNGFWLSSDYTKLSAGKYDLEIRDNIGCYLETSFEVTEPDFLRIDTVLTEAPSCFGVEDGNAIALVEGGTVPYFYNWTLPNNQNIRSSENLLPNMEGGDYTLEIIDAHNCVSASYNFSIEAAEPIEIDLRNIQHVSCTNPKSGMIDVEVTGGQGLLNLEWSNGVLEADITDLDAGIYSLTVTDEVACTNRQSFEVQFTEDSLEVALVNVKNPNCGNSTDGEISLKVMGGFGSYQYLWNNGLQTIDGSNTKMENLGAGTYSVNVVDMNNEFLCKGSLTEIVLSPEGNIAVELIDFTDKLACYGDTSGALFITPNGGNAPYQYLWSNGDTTQNITNLPSGNYRLTVTDTNNCIWESGNLFPEIVEPTNPLNLTPNFVTDSLCVGDANGRIELMPFGGTPPYTYTWNNGAKTASIDNLLPGQYTLTATDQNDCTLQFDTTIAIKSEDLDVTLLSTDLNCFGDNSGFIEAKVICGVPPYRYQWNTGDTTKNLINLAPGAYFLTVTDANDQQMIQSAQVRSAEPLKIETASIDIIACVGQIDLDVSGGIPNSYTYTWRDASGTIISTDKKAINLAVGKYQVAVQDANNCVVTDTIAIDNELIIDSVYTSSDFNKNTNRGTLRVDSIKGGIGPYSYIWFNENDVIIGTGQIIPGVIQGNYYVLVRDQNGCERRQDQKIDQTDALIDLEEVSVFNLYPNPTTGTAFLELQLNEKAEIDISLINAVGKVVEHWETLNVNTVFQKIDLSKYDSGLFYLKITLNEYTSYGEKLFYIKN